ncbi:hypothetical protein IW262DRAFT_1303637 [Armillaria fumosa]|nr:hypothetical protein IW262DRAFT_1303637 [Armillaria fumosa]
MFLHYVRSAWEYDKLKIKIAIHKWMHRKVLRKVLEDVSNYVKSQMDGNI